jgi:apolipoprotein N-acyltransferase
LLVATFLAPWIFGYIAYNGINQNKLDDLNISLIQPNIKLSDSRDYSKGNELLNKLIDKTKSAIDSTTNLVIWPEAALPFHNIKDGKTFNYIKEELLMDNDISILSGDITLNNHKVYNSVILFDQNGVKSVYNKQRPVPLAEQVPLSETFPMLENINLGVANYSSGKEDVLFDLGKYKFSSLICYESTFPEINRRHVNKGADFITFLVNDAWYTHGQEPEQHARQSIFRAIENRRTVLRCANTGISMIIDPTGNIIKKTKLNTEAVILGNIKGTDYKTFYTKFGNVFAQLLFIIMGVLILKTLFRYEKNI